MLKALALKYETSEFLVGDPSWFMHQIEGDLNKELLAFIASSLSYGSRKQFLPKIHYILDSVNNNVANWLLSGRYNDTVPPTDECFYRLYTCRTFNTFLTALAGIVRDYGSLKGLLQAKITTRDALEAVYIITTEFEQRGSKGVIPKSTSPLGFLSPDNGGIEGGKETIDRGGASSCKRVCMFLRWMVRDNSPVDLGLWSDIIDKRTLIIPMDTHVVQEAMRLGLLTSKSTSMSNARHLSARLAEIFPDDPTKGDFALFGLGVDKSKR